MERNIISVLNLIVPFFRKKIYEKWAGLPGILMKSIKMNPLLQIFESTFLSALPETVIFDPILCPDQLLLFPSNSINLVIPSNVSQHWIPLHDHIFSLVSNPPNTVPSLVQGIVMLLFNNQIAVYSRFTVASKEILLFRPVGRYLGSFVLKTFPLWIF